MRRFSFSKYLALGCAIALIAPTVRAQRGDQSRTQERAGADQVSHKPKKPAVQPPRAISVLEWIPDVQAPATKPIVQPATGSPATPAKPLPAATSTPPAGADIPKSARMVPVSIYYQGAYQDAGLFLSQPTPLALQADTVYDLEKAGDPAGTFTLRSAARMQDIWLGYGVFAPLPPPKPFKPNVPGVKIAAASADDDDSDRPVLKRRTTSSGSDPGTGSDAKNPGTTQAPPDSDDPDRPKLKRPAAPPAAGASGPNGADDPDRPKLERKPTSPDSTVSNPRTSDDYLNPADDPNRPHVKRGTYREKMKTLPELLGNPENIRQTVAVSDAARFEEHPFAHSWNDNAERDRARDAMEKLATQKLAAWQQANPALAAMKAPVRAATAHPPTTSRARRPASKTAPASDFTAVQFAAYDLAYQDEPTYVFAAQTAAAGLDQKFVAIVARPDIYGNLQVVFSAITDGSHLALTPRYRLVDAVDGDGDGRAELLLEARNLDGRRFVLLDVYRGAANKVFETGLLP